MIRKNIYKWHRVSSLIIAVPVLLWALSGFLHPVMTNIRPQVATQALETVPVDSAKIKLSPAEVLRLNKVDSVYSIRLVHIDTNWFYQVKNTADDELQYYSTLTGKRLRKGDWLYAQYLARLFLEGQPHQKPAAAAEAAEVHDCCDAATSCALYSTTGVWVTDVQRVTAFDGEYKSINRLLPVYKVSFGRADGIRVYVETGQSRFALAVDSKRAAFTKFFSLVHTFGWLDVLGPFRLWVEGLLASLAFITTAMGLYIFFITKTKKPNGNTSLRARRNHRITAVVASLFTLMFTFSGAYHAFDKLGAAPEEVHTALAPLPVSAMGDSIGRLLALAGKPVQNIGFVALDQKYYWQLYLADGQQGGKDLMKTLKATATPVLYVQAGSLQIFNNGEQQYAKYLSEEFTGNDSSAIAGVKLITKFDEEYNFADKRLPVWKIIYEGREQERVYVETSTATLSKVMTDKDLYQGYSFALLHKHHYMDFAGKAWRDASTMFWVFVQMVMVAFGLILYFRRRRKQ